MLATARSGTSSSTFAICSATRTWASRARRLRSFGRGSLQSRTTRSARCSRIWPRAARLGGRIFFWTWSSLPMAPRHSALRPMMHSGCRRHCMERCHVQLSMCAVARARAVDRGLVGAESALVGRAPAINVGELELGVLLDPRVGIAGRPAGRLGHPPLPRSMGQRTTPQSKRHARRARVGAPSRRTAREAGQAKPREADWRSRSAHLGWSGRRRGRPDAVSLAPGGAHPARSRPFAGG